MTKPAALDFELRSDPALLPSVRDRLRQWTTANGWAEQQIAEIVMATHEALTNVIRHGYGGQPDGRILVRVSAITDPARGNGLEIRIRDFGQQIECDQIRGRDLDDLRPGGLGVHMIRAMTDAVEYSHAPGGGMQIVMRKYQRRSDSDTNPRAGPT